MRSSRVFAMTALDVCSTSPRTILTTLRASGVFMNRYAPAFTYPIKRTTVFFPHSFFRIFNQPACALLARHSGSCRAARCAAAGIAQGGQPAPTACSALARRPPTPMMQPNPSILIKVNLFEILFTGNPATRKIAFELFQNKQVPGV